MWSDLFIFSFSIVCSDLGAQGSEATFSSELNVVTGGPASGEGHQSLLSDDDELETDEELSGGANENVNLLGTVPFDLLMCYPNSNAAKFYLRLIQFQCT